MRSVDGVWIIVRFVVAAMEAQKIPRGFRGGRCNRLYVQQRMQGRCTAANHVPAQRGPAACTRFGGESLTFWPSGDTRWGITPPLPAGLSVCRVVVVVRPACLSARRPPFPASISRCRQTPNTSPTSPSHHHNTQPALSRRRQTRASCFSFCFLLIDSVLCY